MGLENTASWYAFSQSPANDLGSRPCHWRLQAGKRERPMVEEHGGYLCSGCKKSWLSLHSLTHHSTSPAMRGTACEKGDSSRELRNVYRSNLATGLEFRLPIIPAGTKTLLCNMCCMMCITPHVKPEYVQHVFITAPIKSLLKEKYYYRIKK